MPNPARDGHVTAVYVKAVVAHLLTHRIPRRAIERTLGLPLSKLDDPTLRVSGRVVDRALAHWCRELGRPTLGFDVGLTREAQASGVSCVAAATAATVGDALLAAVRLRPLGSTIGDMSLSCEGASARLTWSGRFCARGGEINAHAVVSGWSLSLRSLTGERRSPTRLLFSHPSPGSATDIQQRLDCEVVFDAPCTAIEFPREQLEAVPRSSNAGMHQHLLATFAPLASLYADTRCRVRQRLAEFLARGVAIGGDARTSAIDELHTSRRTLQRRLAEIGITLRDAVDLARGAAALTLVLRRDVPFTSIGGVLGYSESSAFTRAFNRWASASPRTVRTRVLRGKAA
jgi:AraC-like DNA-binding protein